MQQITFLINEKITNKLKEHVSKINGVKEVLFEDNYITVTYDEKKLTVVILKMEIKSFLEKGKLAIITFDKHTTFPVKENTMTLNNLCCENCLLDKIETLFVTDGIKKLSNDYHKNNIDNINIEIKYNPNKITWEEIISIFEN